MKNTDERSFISSDKEKIVKTCHKKFAFDSEKINGKNIIIIDDTIVRGNVMKYICENLKKCGANKIHIRIPSPPVVDICQLGIPINNKSELLMNNHSLNEVSNILNCDTIQFLNKEDLDDIPFQLYTECFGGGIKKEIGILFEKINLNLFSNNIKTK